jgi:hypothetical protein
MLSPLAATMAVFMRSRNARDAAAVLRAIPGHVDSTRIRSSAAAAILTGAPTRLAGK